MTYPDLTLLLSLLVPGEQTREASALLRDPERVPLTLSIVHRLQVENVLLRYLHGSEVEMRRIAGDGLGLWRHYLEEGVFEIASFSLEEAFSMAAEWNAASARQPARWQLLIHVALAVVEKASFMSLDPGLRKRASMAGIKVIPAQI